MVACFGLRVAVDLDIMRHDQTLAQVTTAALEGLHRVIAEVQPACVVVQGDTTTTFCGALAAFYQRVPVAHVEAGLRTYDRAQPFPEEVNRCLTAQVTDFHFAPTEGARGNLLREGVLTEGWRLHPDTDPVAAQVGAALYTGAMAELAQQWLAGRLGDDLDAVVNYAVQMVLRSR